jgi:hypothetical protein
LYDSLHSVSWKSGEVVEAGVVRVPDADWRERIEAPLFHKGEFWRWQVSTLLAAPTGMEANFCVLLCEGEPFSHILTVEQNGVGVLARLK